MTRRFGKSYFALADMDDCVAHSAVNLDVTLLINIVDSMHFVTYADLHFRCMLM
jgi:hypothetical protein